MDEMVILAIALKALMSGGGGTAGKNCRIQSIEPLTDAGGNTIGNRVTFAWTLDDGTARTAYMDVMNGADGADGANGAPCQIQSTTPIEDASHNVIGTRITFSFVNASGQPDTSNVDVMNGTDGAPGAPGSDGDDGASAYEVAVAEGFSGTEAEWLASLVGAPGVSITGASIDANGHLILTRSAGAALDAGALPAVEWGTTADITDMINGTWANT